MRKIESKPVIEYISLIKHLEQLREADKRAVETALSAANEKAKTHNDLLSTMKKQQDTFVTKESVRWAVTALIAGIATATAVFVAVN